MISKENHLLHIKISNKSYEFLKQFSKDFDISISNFCEYCIDSVISDIGFRSKDLSDKSLYDFFQTFSRQINCLYKSGKRSK